MKSRKKSLVASVAVVLAVAGGVSAVADGVMSSPQAQIGVAPAAASGGAEAAGNSGVSAATAVQSAAFPALSRAATTTDVSADADSAYRQAIGNLPTTDGVAPSLGRVVLNNSGVVLSVVPGSQVVCLTSATASYGTQAGCDNSDHAAEQGLVQSTSGDGVQTYGILPAGTTDATLHYADGSTSPLAINADGAFVLIGSNAATITYTTPDGGPQSVNLTDIRTSSTGATAGTPTG